MELDSWLVLLDFGRMNGHGGYRPGAGRKVGSKSKLSVYKDEMLEVFSRHGYSPAESLVKLAMDPATPVKLAARIHSDLLGFVAPKLRATETNIQTDQSLEIIIQKFSSEDFPIRNVIDTESNLLPVSTERRINES